MSRIKNKIYLTKLTKMRNKLRYQIDELSRKVEMNNKSLSECMENYKSSKDPDGKRLLKYHIDSYERNKDKWEFELSHLKREIQNINSEIKICEISLGYDQ